MYRPATWIEGARSQGTCGKQGERRGEALTILVADSAACNEIVRQPERPHSHQRHDDQLPAAQATLCIANEDAHAHEGWVARPDEVDGPRLAEKERDYPQDNVDREQCASVKRDAGVDVADLVCRH